MDNRNKKIMKSYQNNKNSLENYNSRRPRDPFDMMDRHFDNLLSRFGFNDFGGGFGGSLGHRNNMDFDRMIDGFDEEDDGFGFGSLGRNGGNGTCVTQTYVSSVKYDKDGRPQKECYKSQSVAHADSGKVIKEKQQAYKNSLTGVEKAAVEKSLNDKGHKVVKARNRLNGEDYEHTYYKGMTEDEYQRFNEEYSKQRSNVKLDKYYNYLREGNSNQRRQLDQGVRQLPSSSHHQNNTHSTMNSNHKQIYNNYYKGR